MTMQTDTTKTALSVAPTNSRAPVFHEIPALTQAARDAIEEHGAGRIGNWMLGTVLVGVLAGIGVFFLLAASPYLIRVLAPLVQAH